VQGPQNLRSKLLNLSNTEQHGVLWKFWLAPLFGTSWLTLNRLLSGGRIERSSLRISWDECRPCARTGPNPDVKVMIRT
jgi:hypothetical protein